MDASLLTELRAALEAQRVALRPPGRGELAVERLADPIDEAVEQTRREVVASEVNRVNERARLIEAALARMDDGTYGECDCGELIPERRLRAVPWASLCIRCQEAAELAAKKEDEELF